MSPPTPAEHDALLTTTLLLASALSSAILLGSSDATACLHPSADVESSAVSQSDQTALIYHSDGREHLYLSAGVSTDRALSKLGWVVPVPSTPDAYETADPELFDVLADWINLRRVTEIPTLGGGGESESDESDAEPLEVQNTMEAGPYEITPLEASGEPGLKALREWLEEHDLRVPDSTEPARYYVERDWTFLAVRIDPKRDAEELELDGGLPPLHLSFESDRAVYPLKFETNQGEFPVRIYLVTDGEVPYQAFHGARSRGFFVAAKGVGGSSLAPHDLESVSLDESVPYTDFVVAHDRVRRDDAPEALVATLSDAGAFDGNGGDSSPALRIYTLYAPTLNTGAAEPDDWDEDLAIPAFASSYTLGEATDPETSIDDLRQNGDTSSRDAKSQREEAADPDVSTPPAPKDAAESTCRGCGGCNHGEAPLPALALLLVICLAPDPSTRP